MSGQTSSRRTGPRVPSRRRRKRSILRRVVWPTLAVLFVVAAAALAGTLVTSKIARPFQLCDAETREKQRIAGQLEALRKENAALERQISHLKTPQGTADAARKLGYVRSGEIMLVIPEDGPVPATRPE